MPLFGSYRHLSTTKCVPFRHLGIPHDGPIVFGKTAGILNRLVYMQAFWTAAQPQPASHCSCSCDLTTADRPHS